MNVRLAIIVPCYNEEEVLPETNRRLLALLTHLCDTQLITADSGIYYIDDGSRDKTWSLIESLAADDKRAHGIKLSKNRGHQIAVWSGLMTVDADAIISIDADLQDDVSVIESMLREFIGGAEIVYGVRRSRKRDTAFKRNSALLYYWLMGKLGVELIPNHADFRLLGCRAIEALRQYDEVNLFLRGIVPQLGYRTTTVKYDRAERFAGTSKYPLRKMVAFAIEGITSFSIVPLRLITFFGLLVSALSFLMLLYILYGRLVLDTVIPGWASSVAPIYFLGGIQLLSIGILGEYVAKIYLETKRRPRYFIEKTI